jgi:uncharacterized membrane protein
MDEELVEKPAEENTPPIDTVEANKEPPFVAGSSDRKIPAPHQPANPWSLTTRKIVTAGVLAAITIILGISGFGFIPVPNISGRATIEHIPVILGGVLEGPIVGLATGIVFGLISYFYVVPDPFIALARVPIGLTSWLVFIALRRFNRDLAAAVAGIVGTLTNTVLVLTAAVWRGLLPLKFIPTIIPQAIAELIIAAILTTVIARAVYIVQGRFVRAPETKSRDELPY